MQESASATDVILISGVMIIGGALMMPTNPLIGSGLINSGMTMGSKALGSYLSGGEVTYTTAEYFKTGVAGFASGSISAGIAQYGISIGLTGVGNSAFAAVGDMAGNAAAQKILTGQVDPREMIVSGATSFVCAEYMRTAADAITPQPLTSSNTSSPYSGADVVNEGGTVTLKHRTTSGVELTSTPGKTTTVLGRYGSDTGDIINELGIPKNIDFSGNPGGFNLLNTPDDLYVRLGADGFWNEYNKSFLDMAIERGDDILMATPINNSTIYTKSGSLTGYGKEYFYLLSNGYELVDGKMLLRGAN